MLPLAMRICLACHYTQQMQHSGAAALALAVWLAFATPCPTGSVGQPAPGSLPKEPAVQVQLRLEAGCLAVWTAGQEQAAWDLPAAVPYRIVTAGPPAVVTTCNQNLEVATIIASPNPVSYPNMLPMLVEAGYVVLAELEIPDTELNGGTALVNAEGLVVWSCTEGMLVQPAAGSLPAHTFMFADTPGSTAMSPLGSKPDLVLVDAQTGDELWRTSLVETHTPIDAELLAADNGRGLLLLQFGYLAYRFAVLDLQSGTILHSWKLTGQVASQLIYPGGFSGTAQLALGGGVVEILVVPNGGRFERWAFGLENLSLEKTRADPPQYYLDENENQQGGNAIPGPPNPPFPQGMLPTQFGTEWTIPALVDNDGRGLIVNGAGASWLGYNQRD